MYTVAVTRDLIAQHYLVGGDWGAENLLHSHHYRLELQLKGSSLDEHNYLVDIVEIEDYLDELVSGFSDRTLNDLPEFAGMNPSLECFAHIFCQRIAARFLDSRIVEVVVKLWEHEHAWAACRISV